MKAYDSSNKEVTVDSVLGEVLDSSIKKAVGEVKTTPSQAPATQRSNSLTGATNKASANAQILLDELRRT